MSVVGQSVKVLQTLKGHSSDVTSCDFAPNFTLITGSSDKTVRIWDWTPGVGYAQRSNSPLRAHKYQVTCVRVSPQGSMFATASVDGTAILWNLHSATKLYTMTQVNGDAIRVCRFAPDSSSLVTAGDNGAICIWDLVHRSLIRTLFEHEGTTQSLAFTPDSQYLISACSLEIMKVWYVQDLMDTTNEATPAPLAKLDNTHDMGVLCIELSKHIITDEKDFLVKYYKMASCGVSNEIKIWTITSRIKLKSKLNQTNEVTVEIADTYDGHSSSVTNLRFSNNYLISSSLDKLVKIWNQEGSCVATLEGHQRYVNCVAASKDTSLIASGSNDRQIIVWDMNGNISLEDELCQGGISPSNSVDITESQLMMNGDNNDVQLIEKIDDIAEGAINSCCFSGNDLLATGSGDKLIRIFKILDNTLEELSCSPLEGHTYAINHIDFSNSGELLSSCSLDGCTTIWNPQTGEKIFTMPTNSLSVKVCRFSPDSTLLITGGDNDKATIWNTETMEEIAILEGHLDAVTSACFSYDSSVIVTASFNGDYRIWNVGQYSNIFTKEDAHDFGIQSCDFSPNPEPIPSFNSEGQNYLLASCGNDGLVKLWLITVPRVGDELDYDKLEVKLWRSLQGHGGNVIFVRFSPIVGELICSTASDRQARIWSVYGSDCLFVMDHDSIVTSCSFSQDCAILATGCLDKTLWLWKLPQQLVFQTFVANKVKPRAKAIVDWNTKDVTRWLKDIDMMDIALNVQNASLDGTKLLTYSEDSICSGLELDEEQTEKFIKEIRWLRNYQYQIEKPDNVEIPNEFLCPITHEIMREPVVCSDGFTYERNAIVEWFMSGKDTSPMTNEKLPDTDYTFNLNLRNSIYTFLETNSPEE